MRFLIAFAAAAMVVFAEGLPSPLFTDPARRARLEAAFPEIEDVFRNFQQQRGIPGLVFGVVVDGDLAYVKGFGVRERKSQDPVTPETAFRIASMTKSFTALAILKLRDEGKLSLDDPASKWIPELGKLKFPTRDSPPIRIRNLLTHGAGFPEDNPWGDRQLAATDEQLTRWLREGLPFSTAPDTAYEYSNYGFALLGRIVSKASGVPYSEYLAKNILAPLGMRSSKLDPAAVTEASRAMGYRKDGGDYTEEPSLADGSFGPMGGLVTTARDLGRYVAYQLSAFPPRDEEERGPVRRSSQREMQRMWRFGNLSAGRSSPDSQMRVAATGYGYGLGVARDCRFTHTVQHGGGLPGFGSYMMWLPDYGVGVFAMTNLTYESAAPAVSTAFDLLKKTGALQPRQLPPSPVLVSMRDGVVRLWKAWNDEEAARLVSDNFFLDKSAENRRKEIATIQGDVGACNRIGDIEPENLLRGKFRMTCEHGAVEVAFTLAPTMPPKVQALRFTAAVSLDEKAKAVVDALAAGSGSVQNVNAELRRQLEEVRNSHGSCRLGETLGGDGKMNFRVLLECDRGPVELQLRLNEERKILEAAFARPSGITCEP
jgi:CubicO group peptidase (beta-lactamase class C family)